MEIYTFQIFILFQNFAELSLKNYSFFSIARIRDPIEKYSFFHENGHEHTLWSVCGSESGCDSIQQ